MESKKCTDIVVWLSGTVALMVFLGAAAFGAVALPPEETGKIAGGTPVVRCLLDRDEWCDNPRCYSPEAHCYRCSGLTKINGQCTPAQGYYQCDPGDKPAPAECDYMVIGEVCVYYECGSYCELGRVTTDPCDVKVDSTGNPCPAP